MPSAVRELLESVPATRGLLVEDVHPSTASHSMRGAASRVTPILRSSGMQPAEPSR